MGKNRDKIAFKTYKAKKKYNIQRIIWSEKRTYSLYSIY